MSNFLAYIGKHFNAKPKFLISDNVTELVNDECLAYLRKHGIVHQKSMVHTPQQNVVVERKHEHLLDTARALKFHFALLDKFWGDCVLIAIWLINKMPMKILDWKTPFGMLHGVLPSYDQTFFPLKKDSSATGSSLPTQHWPHQMGVQDDENFPCSVPNRTAETVMPNIPKHNGTTLVVQETSTSTYTNQVPPTRRSSRSANVLAIPEHVFYSQSVTNPKWVEAMNKELLEANDTWTLTDLPSGHKAITSK
ncbi:retrovirus-related pol polyprotein from transposon TNT 1-94 [Tanacetum coccineum]